MSLLREDLLAAIRYLERSSTSLTRRRGRAKLRKAVNDLMKQYPLLDGDNVPKKGKRKAVCPLCKVPVKYLREHLARKHCGNAPLQKTGAFGNYICPCCHDEFDTPAGANRHLAALARSGKLREHVIHAATKAAFANQP